MRQNDTLTPGQRLKNLQAEQIARAAATYPIGQPVEVDGIKSQVISSPQIFDDTVKLLCANIGRWVAVWEIKKIEG